MTDTFTDFTKAIRFPPRIGGNICLDFTNTALFRGSDKHIDTLRSYPHVLAWAQSVGLLNEAEAQSLYDVATEQPAKADETFQYAVFIREAVYSIFSAVTDAAAPRTAELNPLRWALSDALPHHWLEATDTGYEWQWSPHDLNLKRPLWPLTLAASELMTSNQLTKVRKCPNCGWLFVDSSRNGQRRWCSMDFCGSKMKSQRQYERKRDKSDE